MGDVVTFKRPQTKTQLKQTNNEQEQVDLDLSQRMERIRASVARLNGLMAELRGVTHDAK
jgi:hypothetical protein